MSHLTDTKRHGPLALIAIIAAGCIGELTLFIGPLFVGSVIEAFAVGEGTVGIIFGIEIAVCAVTALVVANNLRRLPSRFTATSAVLLLIVGNLASFYVGSVGPLILFRVIAALGAGTLFALANALAANYPNPGRTFTILAIAVSLTAVTAFTLIPMFDAALGPRGLFVVSAMFGLVVLLTSAWLPPIAVDLGETDRQSDTNPMSRVNLFILLTVMLLCVGQNGLWSYVERIGVAMNLDIGVISNVLILNTLFAILGPIIASFAYRHFGLPKPIVFALIAQAIAAVLLVYATDLSNYVTTTVLLTVGVAVTMTLLKITMALVDRSGRVIANSTALMTIGCAIGPMASGVLLGLGGSYITIGWMAALAMMVCSLLVILSIGGLSPVGSQLNQHAS